MAWGWVCPSCGAGPYEPSAVLNATCLCRWCGAELELHVLCQSCSDYPCACPYNEQSKLVTSVRITNTRRR